METSLHRALKERYGLASGVGGRLEVSVGGYRIDAIAPDGTLIEVQSGALGPLRGKLRALLPAQSIRVVKPVTLARRVVRRSRRDGGDLSSRRSPKRGKLVDVFDDLVGLVRVFPHPNLSIEVIGVEIDEVRVACRRWPGYTVVDRRLREVVASQVLVEPADLWSLLPADMGVDSPFTTQDLAVRLERPRAFAQRVAYCLRLTGAADLLGKTGNSRVYGRTVRSDGWSALVPEEKTLHECA